MEKRIKTRIGALVVVGMFVAMLYLPGVISQDGETVLQVDGSYRVNIDDDGDEDDRIFSVSHDENDAELFRIQENGRVGIGTTSPIGKLHVVDSSGTYAGYFDAGSSGGISDKNMPVGVAAVAKDGIAIVAHGPGGLSLTNLANYLGTSHISVVGGNCYWDGVGCYFEGRKYSGYFNEADVIIMDGNLGIRTESPSQTLHVQGNARITGALYDSSNDAGTSGQILQTTGSGIDWVDTSSISDGDWIISGSDMYSGVSGNVGIGTTSPQNKLDVDGSFRVSGAATINGLTGIGGSPLTYTQLRVVAPPGREGIQINAVDDYGIRSDVSDYTAGYFSGGPGHKGVWAVSYGPNGVGVYATNQQGGIAVYADGSIGGTTAIYARGKSIFKDGNVGIGDDDPDFKLEVAVSSGNGYFGVSSAAGNPGDMFAIDNAGNVGIGTTSPAEKLDVAGTVQMTGFKMTTDPSSGRVLTSDANGVGTWQEPQIGIGGSGTTNYIPKFTDATTLGNSVIYENGGSIGIGTMTPVTTLDVDGGLATNTITVAMPLYEVPVLNTDFTILADATTNPVRIILPPAAAVNGQILVIKKIDMGPATVTILSPGETIDGMPDITWNTPYTSYMIQADMTNPYYPQWYII